MVEANMNEPILGKFSSPGELIDYVQKSGIPIVDFRFTDLLGTSQHFSIPAHLLDNDMFERGTGFDGSSIRGFQTIDESDMLIVPDPSAAFVDPTLEIRTLAIICDVRDPSTGGNYSRDPRYVARKAEEYLKTTGIADASSWGPEAEFFIFDSARFDYKMNEGYFFIDSDEGIWNSGRGGGRWNGPNLAYRPRSKEGYFPLPPMDSQQDLRSHIIMDMMSAGLDIDKHHHEVATAGQAEIGLHHGPLVAECDAIQIYKYIVRQVCKNHGKVATFMPKPLFGDNGTGMHTHQSLWKDGEAIFYDANGYAQSSETMRFYIGGLLKHAASILAFAAPTTNSYRRLVPGFEAPVNLAYSQRNRSAAVRIPMYENDTPGAKRIEFRCPDPTANSYLAFSAMLMAGLDGIQNKIDPGEPMDFDIYEMHGPDAVQVPSVPGSLPEALEALQADHEYLLRGGVFTQDVIDTWISYKMENEADPMRLRPHPYEYFLYFDA